MAKRVQDNPNHWSDIVGMPDDWDKQNITALIDTFRKKKFQIGDNVYTGEERIVMELEASRKQNKMEPGKNEHGVKIKDSDMRIATAIPSELWSEINKSYPTIFKDKTHFEWFIKNFPEFTVADKY